MGLSLDRLALGGTRVLVAEAPGARVVRAAVERAALGRGWGLASSPAQAGVLVVCGAPQQRLQEAVDRVWDQLPGPRARVGVLVPQDAAPALERAAGHLADRAEQRRDADARGAGPGAGGEEGDDGGHGDDGDMSDMGMAPAGVPLAGGDEDRDGLEMDVLQVPLGPVLPAWPAGLVLRCALHGDVVASAEVEVLAGSGPGGGSAASRAADGAARLLALAGWDDAAAAARRARDALLDGDDARAGHVLEGLRRRVARSRALRWQLRGLGRLDGAALAEHGLPGRLGGDVHDRLLALLDAAAGDPRYTGEGDPDSAAAADAAAADAAVVAALPALVAGLDLAAARLVVASLDPEPVPERRVARG
ncbi:hypothetical protein [Vallicoccus soli]|uniref:Uncharacterized protein n=1 Tax=Vallicoccus soli TaxID=2339232 RepID=A0A3A3ZM00_9ACTN|nr:hypothetical protein [Vallicoccus soli]RJK97595.1 hypothetical protein D5H78_00730 [Vallicoccus soli]